MSFDYGPLRTYEITWRSRPPEMVQGHQVTFDSHGLSFMRPVTDAAPRFHVHGMFAGERWRLVVSGREADVVTIRDVTEQVEALEQMNADGAP